MTKSATPADIGPSSCQWFQRSRTVRLTHRSAGHQVSQLLTGGGAHRSDDVRGNGDGQISFRRERQLDVALVHVLVVGGVITGEEAAERQVRVLIGDREGGVVELVDRGWHD